MKGHILRNFHYLNTSIIDDYISSIEGSLIESEDISEKIATNKGVGAEVGALIKLDAGLKTQIEKETRKKVVQTYASKFQKIYSYLETEENIPYYDYMDEDSWEGISRNQFIEIDVTIRFSKIDTVINSFGNLLPIIYQLDNTIADDDTKKTIYLMNLIKEINQQNGLPAELQLINGSKYKFVSYFEQDCFINEPENMPNEITVFAKIQRKLRDNEKVNLINIVPVLEKLAFNRETRKAMKHKINELPEELFDNVKGPGALIIPIAIYN
jgi:hypothetical protein